MKIKNLSFNTLYIGVLLLAPILITSFISISPLKASLSSNNDALSFEQRKKIYDARVMYLLRYRGLAPVSGLIVKKNDCEGTVHFLQTGVGDHFEKLDKSNIKQIDLKTVSHKPYTGYALYIKNKKEVRSKLGEWGGVHFFVYLGDGKYMSNNGLGPIRPFNSYKAMLLGDGFPHGFADEHGYPIPKSDDIPENAVIGERIFFTEKDIKGPFPPS